MKLMSIAKYIDHTILKPNTSSSDIKKICDEARQYEFAAVCIPPYFVSYASQVLKASKIKVATVIGFPFGYSHYSAKLAEAEQAIIDGADELDMVMNIAAFKENDFDFLKKEAEAIVSTKQKKRVTIKIILETGLLSNEEIIQCCNLYKDFAVDFLKTSTGYADKGASVEAVALLRTHLPKHIQIKASGGIRNFEFASALLEAGATRLGCSASVAIVNGDEGKAAY
jgi:deoxyribose-phosphate aldolase